MVAATLRYPHSSFSEIWSSTPANGVRAASAAAAMTYFPFYKASYFWHHNDQPTAAAITATLLDSGSHWRIGRLRLSVLKANDALPIILETSGWDYKRQQQRYRQPGSSLINPSGERVLNSPAKDAPPPGWCSRRNSLEYLWKSLRGPTAGTHADSDNNGKKMSSGDRGRWWQDNDFVATGGNFFLA